MPLLRSYVEGSWFTATDEGVPLHDAVTGDEVALVSSTGLDFAAALDHGRRVGGPALRELTFHQRAALLKAVGSLLRENREELYALSSRTGATLGDSKFDIDGGFGVLLAYASKAKRELPNESVYVEGDVEALSKGGTFVGQHILTPKRGVAVQIDAFNFPVWGPLEKFAPAFLAGVPSLVKPASQTAYLTARMVEMIVESGLLPQGTLQFVAGSAGDLLDHLTEQDLVSFTGSASTAAKLRTHPTVVSRAVRFNAEADSLNCSILGPDAVPGTPEFDLYVKALVGEMTVKAGQKCTAIRRAFVPAAVADAVADAVSARLARVVIGNPANPAVRMGALASLEQREEVRRSLKALRDAGQIVFGDPEHVDVLDADAERGAFLSPILLRCDEPHRDEVHSVEAFGPVSTLLPYTATTPPSRPGTARRCPRSCTAARVAPAAARRWGACAACCTTCSALRCRLVRRPSLRSPGDGCLERSAKAMARIRSASTSPSCGSATASSLARVRSRWPTSSTSPSSPATRSTPTWTTWPLPRTHSSTAGWRTDT